MPSTTVGYYNTTTKQTANYHQINSKLPANQQITSKPTNQSTNKPANYQQTNQHQIINQIGTLDNYKQLIIACMHAFSVFSLTTFKFGPSVNRW
ncbi:unnamed protein product [Ambrosiozyma monospora]|uniref:Unnamed protein product n=1 Tax=Ambrosiozyma monospora TaxID=43982 RepID=A0A9W6TCS6_AMBMO|nr:unnamed protein product [Ambrosiozyma monospora]